MKNIESVINLRGLTSNNPLISQEPGVYCWWFKETCVPCIINQLNLPTYIFYKVQKKKINGILYYALYFGIANNCYQRLNWHINQKHTQAAVKSGYLSTLRKTLSALLNKDMTKSMKCVNNFIDDNCYVEWDYTLSKGKAECIEKQELSDQNKYYPLNIQGNKTTYTKQLKALRKKYNN